MLLGHTNTILCFIVEVHVAFPTTYVVIRHSPETTNNKINNIFLKSITELNLKSEYSHTANSEAYGHSHE